MTTRFAVDWVDAFSSSPFGGNGCAVVHDAAGLDDETCKRFVRETSLVECTFLGPSDHADVKVRYFLASGEIPFAGHPTVASVAALAHRELAKDGAITLETGAGIIPVEISHDDVGLLVSMTVIAPTFGQTVPRDMVAEVLGLDPDDILAPPQIASTGLPFCITLVRDPETILRAHLNPEALQRMMRHIGAGPGEMYEPYMITCQGATETGDTFGRLLLPPPNPPEDAFTGSATGAAAAWLWHHGHITRPNYVAQQGHGMGRPGEAQVEVIGPADAITGVRLAGRAHVLMSGDLFL
ncbi:PhzF family phenazine biosynthesis protein [Marinovum sp. 2_MG-2023]|uniref:PhzF family phenazine biosynthesis protein n=1 Tax=unclassified Marinovum TaxID=2647166 RepID=UPI0026E13B05|nr:MULTISPECIES: PhzF family phenazine biosynthesis protein [unclassified Marinovum]MDO6731733.1 PhzF family phenazine biosynthesis protein [Marinovum sp. 2_MG-2023]MDO6780985.1 PhzF family phenazine biosynthesis protein [Marinovum sp. 1_MG-2023]